MRLLSASAGGLVVAIALVSACSSDTTSTSGGVSESAVLETYANNLYAAYSDSVTDEQAFSQKVEQFLGAPTESSLADVRTAWLASREHYLLTEGARFYDGPIDIDPPNHEATLNSWPLDEAYVDYSTNASGAVDETVGLINRPDLLPDITIEAVDALNAQGGDQNISNGYHAIEFLLWGQALDPVGPGKRPATDYVTGGPRKNADRRAVYLRVAVSGVLKHLTAVRDAWAPSAEYRTSFVGGGMASVGLIITGLGKMSKGELAGQRMNAAYETKSRRDQHDCFSSQTLVDYERDARGIQGMYLGKYGTTDGPGLDELVRAKDAALDARIQKQLQTSIDAIVAVPKPFEASVVGDDASPGRKAIAAAVDSLRAQGDLFAEAASVLGLSIKIPDENQ
ncbi:Iron-regulated protein A precursor [Labilithrix luteola]|uniref:Iron-regulated protein A n=1 Tax=Labilithrix luteola TaxID=1391654 RepID=A0A0K1PP21_9BACT|nr:imelysin family protein [Labilithrix luteola]AKU94864.1 Iron-regulated protein A precursor [Labilithrix luteola]